jgi:Na+-driven multidrug efflux pump
MAEAKEASYIFVVSAPILILRGFAFALLMMSRNTLLITLSTFVRLIVLSLSLFIWPMFVSGAAIGAAALVSCMFAESVFAWVFAGRSFFALPGETAERPGVSAMWRFSWPLVINQSSEMGVVFVVNLFLGQLAKAELALAAFGVVHGLVSLLMSPMRNLAQTGQTLASGPADVRVLTRFTMQLIAGFVLLALVLFWTPLENLILQQIMGLTAELTAYSKPAMRAAFAMAFFWAFAALFRGLLAGARSTQMLAVTAGLKLGAAALAGAAGLAIPNLNGAMLGLTAWILAYAVEVAVLRPRVRRAWPGG